MTVEVQIREDATNDHTDIKHGRMMRVVDPGDGFSEIVTSSAVKESLDDLDAAPACGVNKVGDNVRANLVKYREIRYKDADDCVIYHFWVACTEPVKVGVDCTGPPA